jgi:hypothetical protein
VREQNLRKVVETAYQKIPRLFFNILPMFNVSQVYYLSLGLPYCFDLHDVLPVECLCAFDSTAWRRNYLDEVPQQQLGWVARSCTLRSQCVRCRLTAMWSCDGVHQVLQEFNKRIYKLYYEWKAKKLTTFALQVQPFSANRTTATPSPPSACVMAVDSRSIFNERTHTHAVTIPNLSYLSTLDCFHPSLLAHQQLAITTWNRYHRITCLPAKQSTNVYPLCLVAQLDHAVEQEATGIRPQQSLDPVSH